MGTITRKQSEQIIIPFRNYYLQWDNTWQIATDLSKCKLIDRELLSPRSSVKWWMAFLLYLFVSTSEFQWDSLQRFISSYYQRLCMANCRYSWNDSRAPGVLLRLAFYCMHAKHQRAESYRNTGVPCLTPLTLIKTLTDCDETVDYSSNWFKNINVELFFTDLN